MLGRYVAGTLMVLGMAMVMAPETPPDEKPTVDVARATTAPVALAVDKNLDDPNDDGRARAANILATANADQAAQLTLASASAQQSAIATQPAVSAAVAPLVTPAAAEPQATVPQPAVVDTPAAEPAMVLLKVTGSRVNVRSGPGTNHGVITSVRRGDEVELLSPDSDRWAEIRITSSGKTGFMARRFLSEGPSGG